MERKAALASLKAFSKSFNLDERIVQSVVQLLYQGSRTMRLGVHIESTSRKLQSTCTAQTEASSYYSRSRLPRTSIKESCCQRGRFLLTSCEPLRLVACGALKCTGKHPPRCDQTSPELKKLFESAELTELVCTVACVREAERFADHGMWQQVAVSAKSHVERLCQP